MRLLCLSLVLAGAVAAQQNIVWNHNNVPTGSGNAFPWGSAGIRYQTIVPNTLLGNPPAWIQDILVCGVPTDPTAREIVYDDIEIRMGMTSSTTLTTAWASNNPTPTTVYRGYLRAVFAPNAWNGIGLPNSYLYLPLPSAPHLCVEVIVHAVRGITTPNNFYFPPTDGSIQRAFLYNWVNTQGVPLTGSGGSKFGLLLNDGNYVVVGAGCNSSALSPVTISGPGNAWPTRGAAFPVSLSGAASRPSFLALGTDLANPIDLAVLGAPGCMVWNDLLLTLATSSNGSGSATVPLGIPDQPPFVGLRLYSFWAQIDFGANALGVTTSGQMKLIVNH